MAFEQLKLLEHKTPSSFSDMLGTADLKKIALLNGKAYFPISNLYSLLGLQLPPVALPALWFWGLEGIGVGEGPL